MPNVEAALTTARLYTHPMRRLPALALVPLLAGCSLISLDLTPRIEPLQEQTVEGHGRAKILLLDVSGFLSDEGGAPSLVIGGPAPARVPLLVRVREELTKAAADPDVRALVVRIDSAGGTDGLRRHLPGARPVQARDRSARRRGDAGRRGVRRLLRRARRRHDRRPSHDGDRLDRRPHGHAERRGAPAEAR